MAPVMLTVPQLIEAVVAVTKQAITASMLCGFLIGVVFDWRGLARYFVGRLQRRIVRARLRRSETTAAGRVVDVGCGPIRVPEPATPADKRQD